MTSPLKPCSRFLPNFTYSIYNPEERIIMFFVPIGSELWLLWQLIVAIDKKCFYCRWSRPFVAMTTSSFHKSEVSGLYFYLSADILTKVLQKLSLSSPLPSIQILSKQLSLFGCHGNRKAKFAHTKNIQNHLLRSHQEMKLKLCKNVHNISLHIFFFFLLFIYLFFFFFVFFVFFLFFCYRCSSAFVVMTTWQLQVSIDL